MENDPAIDKSILNDTKSSIKNDPIVESILKERYYQLGETCWRDIAWRVANFIGDTANDKSEYFDVINNKEFIPNTPALINSGKTIPMLFACYALGADDSIDSIFDTMKVAAKIMKMGGGVGIDWSYLRPEGALVKSTNGTSSGVISFMQNFDAVIETVKSGGVRRGAGISLLDIDHGDIEKFITCKDIEGTFPNFNISVKITDDFMKNLDDPDNKQKFDMIATAMWKRSEPGICFIDTVKRNLIVPLEEDEDVGFNPCVTADTLILTRVYGYQPIASFVNENIEIWNGYKWSSVTPKVTGVDQETIWIDVIRMLDNAEIIEHINCTPYHKFILYNGTRVEASNLKVNDRLTDAKYPSGESAIVKVIGVRNGIKHHKVYCLNEPENHTFLANGIIVGNCGEQPLVYNRKLLAGECCNLGSINMSILYDAATNWIDINKLKHVVRVAVRYLDESIDKSVYPTKEIEHLSKQSRKIGLGEMGWADLFIHMGIRYGSHESIEVIKQLKSIIKETAIDESCKLAMEKGEFPRFKNSNILNKRRNSAISTEAPTGSLSLFAGVSSGIEPVFSYVVERKNSCGTGTMVHKLFDESLQNIYQKGSKEYNDVIEYCLNNGSIQNCNLLPDEFKNIFVTALDVLPNEHIDVQAEFQKYTDASISKTLNLLESTTVEEIKEMIKYSWESGLKGMTIYRQGSRDKIVYDINVTKKESVSNVVELANPVEYKLINANGRILPKTPRRMMSVTEKRQSNCCKLYITIGEVEGKPHTILIKNKGGGCTAMLQTVAELSAAMLRWQIPQWELVRILNGITCDACKGKKNLDGRSCADIIGKVIRENYPDEEIPPKEDDSTKESPLIKIEVDHPINSKQSSSKCPECGNSLNFTEGCRSCQSCGWTRCS